MPELPEVETVRRGLAPHIEGRRITDFTLHRADLRFPFPKDFEKLMRGAQVKSFNRRAKYLLAEMQDKTGTPFTWLSHLGMTGRFMLSLPQAGNLEPGAYAHEVTAQTAQKHIHVEMRFDDGTHLSFADPRRFGFMDCFLVMSGLFFWPPWGLSPWAMILTRRRCFRAGAQNAGQKFSLDQMWLVWAIYVLKRCLWRVSAHADKR